MSLVVNFDPRALEAEIRNIAERASSNSARTLRRASIRIRDLARDYAPHKTGALEEGISDAVIPDGRRKAFVVFAPHIVHRGVDYVELMHEKLQPHGSGPFNLGPGSQAKGGAVGGLFLERAVEEGTKNLRAEAMLEIRRALEGNMGGGFQ